MNYAFIKNNLVGNIVDESKVSSCPQDHEAVQLNDGESCGIFWLYSPTETPRFKARPTFDSGLYNIGVSEVNGVFNWKLNKKPDAEIETYISNLSKQQVESLKQKLLDDYLIGLREQRITELLALDDTAALVVADEYEPFVVGKSYQQNERFYYPVDQKLYKVLQSHTSAAQWLPNDAVSLYVEVTPPGVIAEWKQPTGAHDAYDVGAQVTWNGHLWENTSPANVYEPGVWGWTDLGVI